MRINLHEIPEEGREYLWSTPTGELTQTLQELIGSNTYTAQFTIRPMNHKDFELRGTIKTRAPDLCSRCGDDIKFPVEASFHEILIPPQEQDRSGRYSKVNHISESVEEGPGAVEYTPQMQFDMGEYLHETVAISIPYNPAPPLNSEGKCSECNLCPPKEAILYADTMEEETPKPNPFAALKGLKLQ